MPAGIVRPPLEDVEAIRMFLEKEGIAPGAHLLDVPCGIGRRAVGLAEAGYQVTAVDPNEMGIAAATERVPHAVVKRLHFASASRDSLPGLSAGARFDAILCLDHALGRGSAADDLAFLRRLAAHIRPEGRLVLDLLNRDFFASRQRPFAFHMIGSFEQHEFRSFDPVTGVLRLEWKFYERIGEDLKHRTDSSAELTLLTPRDVAWNLGQSGWRIVGVWGGWRREAVTADHRKLIVLATAAVAEFSLTGPLYLAEEVIAVLAAIGVGMALYRRYVIRPKKLMHEGMRDATIVLCFILGIVISFLLFNAADAAAGTVALPAWKPISSAIASTSIFSADPALWWRALWWTHVVLLFSFLAYVPHSKHIHIIFAIVNTFFMDLTPKGALKTVDLEKTETFGVNRVEQLSWRQLLDGYACTECGRCTAACPANATGKPLAPMRIITNIRETLNE